MKRMCYERCKDAILLGSVVIYFAIYFNNIRKDVIFVVFLSMKTNCSFYCHSFKLHSYEDIIRYFIGFGIVLMQ